MKKLKKIIDTIMANNLFLYIHTYNCIITSFKKGVEA